MAQTSSNFLNLSSSKGIYRSATDRKLRGICGGIAERYGVDATIVRVAFVLATLFLISNVTGWALFSYVIAALMIRERPSVPAVIDATPSPLI